MADQYFMRNRGRVLGPFDVEKLRGLVRRGQLSRMHEVSLDGVSWVRASDFPELFENQMDPSVRSPVPGTTTPSPTTTEPPLETASDSVSTQKPWYYSVAGAQKGPVEFEKLQLLIGNGQLGPDELVWSDGMASWTPASQVPELMTSAPSGMSINTTSADSNVGSSIQKQSANVYRTAMESRPWVLFLAIVYTISGALSLIGALILGVLGMLGLAAEGAAVLPIILPIFATFLGAIVNGYFAYLLYVYAGRLAALRHTQNDVALSAVHRAQKNIWVFLSVFIIIMFFIVIGCIILAVLGFGIALANFPSSF